MFLLSSLLLVGLFAYHGDIMRTSVIPVSGWLGVSIQNVTPEIARRLGLQEAKGVFVNAVVEGSPAKRAGIRIGDVIIEYGGSEVHNAGQLKEFVEKTQVGQKVAIVIIRERQKRTVEVIVGDQPRETARGLKGGLPRLTPVGPVLPEQDKLMNGLWWEMMGGSFKMGFVMGFVEATALQAKGWQKPVEYLLKNAEKDGAEQTLLPTIKASIEMQREAEEFAQINILQFISRVNDFYKLEQNKTLSIFDAFDIVWLQLRGQERRYIECLREFKKMVSSLDLNAEEGEAAVQEVTKKNRDCQKAKRRK